MRKKAGIVKFVISTQSKKFRKQLNDLLSDNNHYSVVKIGYSLKNHKILPQNIQIDFIILHCDIIYMADIALIKDLKQQYKNLNILVIAEENALKHIRSLCMAGADGFLIKQEINKLQEAIETILSGKRYMNQILLNCLFQDMLAKGSDTYDDHFAIFNLKEHQVFQLIDAGYSEDTIADILDISLQKVMLYKKRLINKTGTINLCNKK